VKWLIYALAVLAVISSASAWETTTYYYSSVSQGSQWSNGTVSFNLLNATVEQVHSAIFTVNHQYASSQSLNITLKVNGQYCSPSGFAYTGQSKVDFFDTFNCLNIISTNGTYTISVFTTASSIDQITVTGQISYTYADSAFDTLFLHCSEVWNYLTGWMTSTLQSIWANTNSTLTISNQTLANTQAILRIEGNETNYTPQLNRIEGKIDNLTDQFRFVMSSVTQG
jgi:hypothetical protein